MRCIPPMMMAANFYSLAYLVGVNTSRIGETLYTRQQRKQTNVLVV